METEQNGGLEAKVFHTCARRLQHCSLASLAYPSLPFVPLLHVQILSRTKPVQAGPLGGAAKEKRKKQKLPRLEDFLAARDYTGALTLLEVRRE